MDKAEWHDNQAGKRTTSREEREIRRQLRSANTLGGFSLFGIIIPLAGWIFGGIALSKARAVLDDLEDDDELHDRYIKRVRSIRTAAIAMIVISCLSALGWTLVFIGNARHASTSPPIYQPQESALQNCITQADSNYWNYVSLNATGSTKNADGTTTTYRAPQAVWDQANSQKQQDINTCSIEYK